MMNKILTAVFDAAVGQFTDPISVRSEMEALRSFTQFVNDPQSDFNRFAEDYTLFSIGEFDPDTGELIKYNTPTKLGHAVSLLTRAPSQGEQVDFVDEEGSAAPH